MPGILEQFNNWGVAQQANQLQGTAMGLLLEGHNDKRQLAQQQSLQELQIKGNKEMLDYAKQKDLEMWKATSYPGQLEMMKQAGLNPALMYGMGGGGGVTTGGGAQSVTGANAPQGGKEILESTGMALQMAMMRAQMENLNADTELKRANATNVAAETTKKPAEKENIEMSTKSLAAGITNTKAQAAYAEAQTTLAEIQADINGSEINDMKAAVRYGMRKLYSEMRREEIQQNVDEQTQQTKIKQAQATLAVTAIDAWLKKAQTQNIAQDTVNKAIEIKLQIQANMREWDKLGQGDKSLMLQEQKIDYDTAVPAELKAILDNIFIVPTLSPMPKRNPVGFKY